MTKAILNYFEFTRSERNGTVLLTLLCLATYTAPEIAGLLQPARSTDFSVFQKQIAAFLEAAPPSDFPGKNAAVAGAPFAFDPNRATYDDFLRLGLPGRTANTILNYRDHGGRFHEADDFQKIYGLAASDFARLRGFIQIETPEREAFTSRNAPANRKIEPFKFDPNTASTADFVRLGLPERTAQTIQNYRSKGGIFRQKTDFKKIYALREDDFERLKPFIEIAPATTSQNTPGSGQIWAGKNPGAFPGPKTPDGQPADMPREPKNIVLDINTATAEAWQQLPGIGQFRAEKIVLFREKLGGFVSIEQVAEARGLPDSVFQKIRPMLVLKTPVYKKINLNVAEAEAFSGHPYFDKKKASLILAYRAQHGPFASADGLASIAAFRDRAWLEKVKPYLSTD